MTTSTTSSPNTGIQPSVQTQIAANFLNNLNYGVCIARHPQMCAIRWQAIEFDFGGNLLGQSTPADSCVGDTTLSNDNDYLVIPFGTDNTKSAYVERFCGQRLSSALVASSVNTDVFCKFTTLKFHQINLHRNLQFQHTTIPMFYTCTLITPLPTSTPTSRINEDFYLNTDRSVADSKFSPYKNIIITLIDL